MADNNHEMLKHALAAVSPGTALRDGLDRILRGRTGALIVLGMDNQVAELCTGGFILDADFSATKLRELAKMDGGIVVDAHRTKLLRAAVHFVPDPMIQTSESGTRHRTAERVAKQTGYPVISVSQSMRTITVYAGDRRVTLESTEAILARGNQALSTLERYKTRLDEKTATLSALEVEDLVTIRDVAAVMQRHEMVRRISEEISDYIVQLGSDGRLLALQLDDLTAGTAPDRDLILRDYLPHAPRHLTVSEVTDALSELTPGHLVDLGQVARALGHEPGTGALDQAVRPRGYRMLSKVPRLPVSVLERLVTHFDDLQELLAASHDEFQRIDAISGVRAQHVRDGLARLAEAYLLDQPVEHGRSPKWLD